MFCSKCGQEIKDGVSFCTYCGTPCAGNAQANEPIQNRLKKSKKVRKLLTIAIIAVVVVGLVGVISYFNSAAYLEKRLTSEVWYSEPYKGIYGGRVGSVVKFRLNGKAEYNWQSYNYMEDEWWSDGNSKREWEITKDKTLYLNGKYYNWNSEWSLHGDKLVIGDYVYYSNDLYGYEED